MLSIHLCGIELQRPQPVNQRASFARGLRLIASWCTAPTMRCHISTRTRVLTKSSGAVPGRQSGAAIMFFLRPKAQQRASRKNRSPRYGEDQMPGMKKALLAMAVAAGCIAAGPALAQKKQLVIVVKGLDNPFFEAIHQGCEKWNKENASSQYQCFYTGPASTSDEAGEAQIVQDILGKADTAAIAI